MSHRPYDVHLSRPLVMGLDYLNDHPGASRREVARAVEAMVHGCYESVYGTFSTLKHWGLIRKTLRANGKPKNGYWEVTGWGREFLAGSERAPVTLTVLDKEALPAAYRTPWVYFADVMNGITHAHPATEDWDRDAHDTGPMP